MKFKNEPLRIIGAGIKIIQIAGQSAATFVGEQPFGNYTNTYHCTAYYPASDFICGLEVGDCIKITGYDKQLIRNDRLYCNYIVTKAEYTAEPPVTDEVPDQFLGTE